MCLGSIVLWELQRKSKELQGIWVPQSRLVFELVGSNSGRMVGTERILLDKDVFRGKHRDKKRHSIFGK